MPNFYPLYDLLECMKTVVLWNYSHRIIMTQGNRRISERSFGDTPLSMSEKAFTKKFSLSSLFPPPMLPIFSTDLVPFPFSGGTVERLLVCFQVLAITNNAAVNIVEQMSLYECASFGYMPKSGIAGSCGTVGQRKISIYRLVFQSLIGSLTWSQDVASSGKLY
ncbi:Protein of unknown function DUF3704 containing protein [Cricetulus griseus]|nr:Protein of unknown function DUF3704 containing protein [Cricetulus griseus]